jgi:ABC-type Fe3+-hydroxamate transport system substrate-binding protein
MAGMTGNQRVQAERDDLGYAVELDGPVRRVVSLVPSLTESVAVARPDALVGATQWCTHPAGLDVPRVRGTKNPDLAAIAALRPGLVLANQEENRRVDVERLRAAGVPVWVTVIRTLDEAFASLRRMFTLALGWPAPPWLDAAEHAWQGPPQPGEPENPGVRAVIPVWRDPWMVVGSGTFAGDVAARLGLVNVFGANVPGGHGSGGHEGRYPKVTLDDIAAAGPELIVLPDEPYQFTATDGPQSFPGQRVALVSGRDLTWYGPSLVTARERLAREINRPAAG